MSKTQHNPAGNHDGELTDDQLDQVSGGATQVLYDFKVAGMRIRATWDPETGDARTCVTGAGCRATTVD